MADEKAQEPTGPDFKSGIDLESLVENSPVLGHFDGEAIILVRQGGDIFAVGATCTHYHGPLAEGLVVGETIRCPWHHACFSLRTGEALRAPALDALKRWRVERTGDTVFVRGSGEVAAVSPRAISVEATSIVIVGGGAAGLAAADMLRREGYDGPLTLISADAAPPCDQPNLSKDFLAGSAPEDWIPLRPPEYYTEQ